MCMCVCLSVCICTMCGQEPEGVSRGIGSLRNYSPLQEQCTLLTVELSLLLPRQQDLRKG